MAQLLNRSALEAELQTGLTEARYACEISGAQSNACAAAWDIVEELKTAIADLKVAQKTSLEVYCDQNPAASECRIYDV